MGGALRGTRIPKEDPAIKTVVSVRTDSRPPGIWIAGCTSHVPGAPRHCGATLFRKSGLCFEIPANLAGVSEVCAYLPV